MVDYTSTRLAMGDIKKVNIPAAGFIKTTGGSGPKVTGEQRARLIRQGNELCNKGLYDVAERIFVTLHYSDGMLRVGDALYKRREYARAMRLYMQAPDPRRVERLSKRMSLVVKQWLIESERELKSAEDRATLLAETQSSRETGRSGEPG
jgi:hypothetical protein